MNKGNIIIVKAKWSKHEIMECKNITSKFQNGRKLPKIYKTM